MTRSSLVWPVACALLAFGCGGGGCEGTNEACDVGNPPQASEVELGYDDDGTFVPLDDGDVRPLIYGSQGGTMIGIALRVRGSNVPECLTQATEVYTIRTGELLDANRSPRKTYEQADGGRATANMLLVLADYLAPAGDAVRVVGMAGDKRDEVVVYIDFAGTTDAAVPDGGPSPDGGAGDAAISDAAAMLDAPADDAGSTDAQ